MRGGLGVSVVAAGALAVAGVLRRSLGQGQRLAPLPPGVRAAAGLSALLGALAPAGASLTGERPADPLPGGQGKADGDGQVGGERQAGKQPAPQRPAGGVPSGPWHGWSARGASRPTRKLL